MVSKECKISEKYKVKIDADSIKSVDISLVDLNTNYPLCDIQLISLWLNKPTLNDTVEDFELFSIGDYMQNNFHSYPKLNGFGTTLHNWIINNIRQFKEIEILNIYSTRYDDTFSTDSEAYWESKVKRQTALKDERLVRYKLLF